MEGGGARKLLQRQLYTFLSSKWGVLLCLIGFLTILNASFTLFSPSAMRESGISIFSELDLGREADWRDWTDNIAGRGSGDSMCSPPIDIVYTWVNGSDPRHQQARSEWKRRLSNLPLCAENDTESTDCYRDIDSSSRYADNEELRYSLRAIEKFAPWIRRIYLVTNGQVPYWLNLDAPRLTVVTHAELFTNHSHLPTFSSPAIESHLHRIPGLSDKFLYLNDDVMFGNTVWPEDFFSPQLGYKVYLSWSAPLCAPGCYIHYLNDGFCDEACNHTLCDYDFGECLNETVVARGSRWGHHRAARGYRDRWQEDSLCNRACADAWLGDKACDTPCNVEQCGYDMGDCGLGDVILNLPHYDVLPDTTTITFHDGTHAGYINLGTLLPTRAAHLIDAVHSQSPIARQITFVQSANLLVVAFHKNQQGCVDITVRYMVHRAEAALVERNYTQSNETVASDNVAGNETHPQATEQLTVSAAHSNSTVSPAPGHVDVDHLAPANATVEGTIAPPNADPYDYREIKFQICVNNAASPKQMEAVRQPEAAGNDTTQPDAQQEDLELEGEPNFFDDMESLSPEERAMMQFEAWEEGRQQEAEMRAQLLARQEQQNLMGAEREGSEAAVQTGEHEEDGGSLTEGDIGMLQELAEKRDVDGLLATPNCDESTGVAAQNNSEEIRSQLRAQSKKRTLALSNANDILQAELLAERDENRRLRKERLKEEELSLLMEADLKGTMPSLRSLREAVLAEQEAEKLEAEQREANADGGQIKGWQKRKLMDAFGDSIRHVNRLYNRLYGIVQRSVPAHMPHFIDKKVMGELMERFPEEWAETSSHHFRAGDDMQYSFSYYYYLMSERKKFSLDYVWRTYLDTDHDGELSLAELRTLGALSLQLPIQDHKYMEMLVCVSNNFTRRRITPDALRACPFVLEGLERWAKRIPRFPHTVMGTDDVAFLAVKDDTGESAIDGIRERRQKFVCLNDDLSHTESSERMLESLQSFYKALVPMRSKFELPDWDPNPYLYEMNAYRATVRHRLRFLRRPLLWLYTVLSISIVALVLMLTAEYSPAAKSFFQRHRLLRWLA